MDDEENDDHRRQILIGVALVALLLVFVVAALLWPRQFAGRNRHEGGERAADEGGGRFERPAFYHADSGTWLMLDPVTDVLRERKYVSGAAERERYLVREVPAKGQLRIVEARQRWKRVEVLEKGVAVATGWVDAEHTRKARLVAKTDANQPTLYDSQGRDLLGQTAPITLKSDVSVEQAFLYFSMFGVRIDLDESIPQQKRERLIETVTYENASLREALDDFCRRYGLRWQLEDERIIVRAR